MKIEKLFSDVSNPPLSASVGDPFRPTFEGKKMTNCVIGGGGGVVSPPTPTLLAAVSENGNESDENGWANFRFFRFGRWHGLTSYDTKR